MVGIEVGAEVVMHCGWWDAQDQKDDILDMSAKIWGYEINHGAFAEFAKVKGYAVLPKPSHLSWAEAASYMLCGATAYRMLHGFHPHTIQKGDVVLIWGGSGGVGCMATQLSVGSDCRIYLPCIFDHTHLCMLRIDLIFFWCA